MAKGKKIVWTENLKQQFISDYGKITVKEMQAKYNMGQVSVNKYLNLFYPDRQRWVTMSWSKNKIEEFKRDYPKLSLKQMAEKYSISERTVSKYGKQYGIVGIKKEGQSQR